MKFEPTGDTKLDKPKFGKQDPDNEPHSGGNTWAGGVSVLGITTIYFTVTHGVCRLAEGTLRDWVGAEVTCVYTKGMISNR